jgi:flagellar basal body-associated protein FliL
MGKSEGSKNKGKKNKMLLMIGIVFLALIGGLFVLTAVAYIALLHYGVSSSFYISFGSPVLAPPHKNI